MIDVRLKIFNSQNAALYVTHEDGVTQLVVVEITHTTPMTQVPLLGKCDADFMPQELLDTLFRMQLDTEDDKWWQDYFICRRTAQEQYADAIARNDEEFRADAEARLSI